MPYSVALDLTIFTNFPTTLPLHAASDEVRGHCEMKALLENHTLGQALCPICTHTVPAEVNLKGKTARVAPGQKCPRCTAALDVAVVVAVPEAA